MSHVYNVHAFLEHAFPDDEQYKILDTSSLFGYQKLILPHNDVPINRDVISGELKPLDLTIHNLNSLTTQALSSIDSKKNHTILPSLRELSDKLHNKLSIDLPNRCKDNNNMKFDVSIREEIIAVMNKFLPLSTEEVDRKVGTINSDKSSGLDHQFESLKTVPKKTLMVSKCLEKFYIQEDTTVLLPTLEELIHNPAMKFPFELDTFQKQAILCLERNQNVFVSAHTSAGKTVVAEYACALCRRRGSKVVYTSPIKALSNQKFYDFKRKFHDNVGLITGDIKLAPESTLLVMTTEILHNMLCNSADIIRDLEIVIMDEVHYVNDPDRGHVWEQIMIMLPKHVTLVMLSATVPNKLEFADWLGRIRGSQIHVIATTKRPVPLEHYLFTGLDGQHVSKHLHLIVDRNNQYNPEGYKQAVYAVNPPKDETKSKSANNSKHQQQQQQQQKDKTFKPKTGNKYSSNIQKQITGSHMNEQGSKNLWLGVIRLLKEQQLMPAIAFSFSRNALENLAHSLDSVDLLTNSEKQEVKEFIYYSIKKRLTKSDQKLHSVEFVSQLVMRGLAIHHAGMLPLLKETIEMLFQRGLVRILFATETFSMGVNMPARCVIFTTLEKFDGQKKRPLTSSEYTQMAGRAGRRGLDSSGYVIMLLGSIGNTVSSSALIPPYQTLTNIILGSQTQLVSKFKITYSMILHLHRTNWLSPQDIMRSSFMELISLKRENDRKNWLSLLRLKLKQTTIPIPSVGANSFSQWMNVNKIDKQSVTTTTTTMMMPNNSDRFNLHETGEPILQVKCPSAFTTFECSDAMVTYYQACARLYQLNWTMSQFLANQNINVLQSVFCTGRVVFVRLNYILQHSTNPSNANKAQLAATKKFVQPNWIVPAVVVNFSKTRMGEKPDLLLRLISWSLKDPLVCDMNFKNSNSCTTSTGTTGSSINANSKNNDNENSSMKLPNSDCVNYEETDEERILSTDEDPNLTPVPYPPQLMPCYAPESLGDGLSQLDLFQDLSARNLVRICDEVLDLNSIAKIQNANLSISDHLLDSIKSHRMRQSCAESGMFMSVKENSFDSDTDSIFMLDFINQTLFNLVHSFNSDAQTQSTLTFGLPANRPLGLNLLKAFKIKQSMIEETSLFDEWGTLNEDLTTTLWSNSCKSNCLAPLTCPDLVAHLHLAHQTCRRRWALKRIESSLSDSNLRLNTEYLSRLHVLEELGFIDVANQNGCLSLKGRVACELSKMEVLLTQLLFEGSFTQLEAPDIVGILSCFVFNATSTEEEDPNYLSNLLDSVRCVEKNESVSSTDNVGLNTIPRHLFPVVNKLLEFAINLQELQSKHGLINPCVETRVNLKLVGAARAWATGQSFSSVLLLADIPEGHLVRTFLQIEELLRHICSACFHFGDHALSLRMTEARNAINRDLVCVPSLYISEECPQSS